MHLEMMRTFPVPAHHAYDYMLRFKLWPKWAGLHKIRSKGSKWEKKGDVVHFVYQPFVPVAFAGEIELLDLKPHKMVKGLFRMPGIDEATMTWIFTPVGDRAFTLKIELDTPELETRFARSMHHAMRHGPMFQGALMRQMDGLDTIFAKGIPRAAKPRHKTTPRAASKKAAA